MVYLRREKIKISEEGEYPWIYLKQQKTNTRSRELNKPLSTLLVLTLASKTTRFLHFLHTYPDLNPCGVLK